MEEKLEDCEKHLRSKDAGKTRAAMMSQLEQWVPEVRRPTRRPATPSCAPATHLQVGPDGWDHGIRAQITHMCTPGYAKKQRDMLPKIYT